MLKASDSFIEYLAAGLATSSIPVYWWRQSATDEHDGFLKQDALNVQILGFFESGSIEYCLISLDLLGSDERVVLGRLETIRELLFEQQFIPELDYSNPSSPIATGRSVCWEANKIKFLNVRTPRGTRYAHYNASFPLTHTRQ